MEIIKLTVNDVKKYSSDIIVMLKQSYEKSFPKMHYENSYFLSRVETLASYIESGNAFVYGSLKKGNLTGFIWFFEKNLNEKKSLHINHFVVHEKFRRLGIGKMLWNEVEKYATKRNIEEIELLVTKANEGAVTFYQRNDFEIDRYVMKKRL